MRWPLHAVSRALKNLGHQVHRSTIARILKAQGLPPAPKRPTSWHTLLRAHWGAIAAADFFTTEVWTWRGLVTFYTVFVIDLASHRVQMLGATPHPDEVFMRQITRTLTMADVQPCRVLICDRDAKWSVSVRERLTEAGIRVVQTPFQAPNANAYAERFVRSINEECLDRLIPIWRRAFATSGAEVRRALPPRAEPSRSGERLDRERTGCEWSGPSAATSAACSMTTGVQRDQPWGWAERWDTTPVRFTARSCAIEHR